MVYNPKTNYKTSEGIDLGEKLITKDYLISVYPNLVSQLGVTPQLWSWGYNIDGQLGLGNVSVSVTSPNQVDSSYNWKSIKCSSYHSLAIKKDGTLWAWGSNLDGVLGIGPYSSISRKTSPTQVGISSDWKKVSSYSSSSYGIKNNGALWSWGYNAYGQLGIGNYTDKNTPTQVGISSDWRVISDGDTHALGIKTDGTLWAWGDNSYGKLGINNISIANVNIPTLVGSDSDWKDVACGNFHSIALKTDGTLWSWGYNERGQLGIGNTLTKITPNQIGTGSDWNIISAGEDFSAAIKTDGSLWTWGYNASGNLGVGDTVTRNSPIKVGISSNWKSVECGNTFTMAIKTDGTLWAWGFNFDGQLGLGDKIDRYNPTQVGISKNWKQISGGNDFTIGIQSLDFI